MAPAAIQQAHFYTVDGLFALLSLLVFHALLHSLHTGDRRWYAAAGLLIGAAGAVRLNGLLLGLVLLAGHLARARPGPGLFRRFDTRILAAGAAAAGALVVLQPYLLTDPSRLLSAETSDDLAFSLSIARDELLRIWGLIDLHTTPFLHYFTHLLPQAVGWPLAWALTVAVGAAAAVTLAGLRRRTLPDLGLVLLWCGLYFAVVGGLQTRHVRYLLPLLPLLSVLAGDLAARLLRADLGRRWRAVVAAAGLATLVHAGLYGLAFARIYGREDPRIAAARWIAGHVPEGDRLGIEGGGFSMARLIDQGRHAVLPLGMSTLFESRGYLTCGAAWTFLQDRVRSLDNLTLADVNRMRPFTAVPELLPAGAGLYERLSSGQLGFGTTAVFHPGSAAGGHRLRP